MLQIPENSEEENPTPDRENQHDGRANRSEECQNNQEVHRLNTIHAWSIPQGIQNTITSSNDFVRKNLLPVLEYRYGRAYCSTPVRGRLTAGQRALDPPIMVRIHAPEPHARLVNKGDTGVKDNDAALVSATVRSASLHRITNDFSLFLRLWVIHPGRGVSANGHRPGVKKFLVLLGTVLSAPET